MFKKFIVQKCSLFYVQKSFQFRVYSSLPTAYCLLHTAYCSLLAGFSSILFSQSIQSFFPILSILSSQSCFFNLLNNHFIVCLKSIMDASKNNVLIIKTMQKYFFLNQNKMLYNIIFFCLFLMFINIIKYDIKHCKYNQHFFTLIYIIRLINKI